MKASVEAQAEAMTDKATALRKALEAPRHLVPEEIWSILEDSFFKNMKHFDPQVISGSLHMMVKKKYRPQERLVSAIEQHAEEISGEFNPQNVAKPT
jgi:hypothetical protein